MITFRLYIINDPLMGEIILGTREGAEKYLAQFKDCTLKEIRFTTVRKEK